MLQAEIDLKIKQAFCPPKIVKGNPCIEYIKYIIFPWFANLRWSGSLKMVETSNNPFKKTLLSFRGKKSIKRLLFNNSV